MKKIILVVALHLLMVNCAQQPEADTDLLHLIPQKSAAILRVPKWESLKNSLKANEFSNRIKPTGFSHTLSNYAKLLSSFNPKQESYISFVALGENDYDIALFTEVSENLIPQDSLFRENLIKTDYEGTIINSFKVEGIEVFFITTNNILIASTSKLILENTILQGNTGRDPIDASLQKMIKTSDAQQPNLYIKGTYFKRIFKDLFPLYKFRTREIPFEWAAIDLNLNTKENQFSGVITADDQQDHTLNLLKNLESGEFRAGNVIPISSRAFTSLHLSDWNQYKANLATKRNSSLKEFTFPIEEFFTTLDEVAISYTDTDAIIIAHSSDTKNSEDALAPVSTKNSVHREVPIYSISDSLVFRSPFLELLNPPAVYVYCKVDSYFVFAKTISELEDVIANKQNGAVISRTPVYKQLVNKLSDQSTLFLYANNDAQRNYLSTKLSKTESSILTDVNLVDYPNSAIQFIQADNFTYVNGVINKFSKTTEVSQVSQVASIKLDQDLLDSPQLLENYRTKGKNILVQDVSNTLYHIDASGKIEWKKELEGPILGDIQQVDLYKNGRLQYAFVTPNHFYILASDGDIVKPFGFKLETTISQPLAIFDYDGNRNYRFVITQGNELKMYDSNASIVKGFDYTKASTNLNSKPQHLRSGSKDYIIMQLENGHLDILDRRGHSRIDISEKFKFSGLPISLRQGNFSFYEADGSLVTISESGKISRNKKKLTSGFLHTNINSFDAALNDNKLIINGKEKELELGIYKGLKSFMYNKKYYTVLTDLQTNKVYLFDQNGNTVPNFPVYGTSKSDLGNINSQKLGLVTKGESNSIIIYQIN